MIHHATSPANGITAIAFGPGEGIATGTETPDFAFVGHAVDDFIHAPIICFQRRKPPTGERGGTEQFTTGAVGHRQGVGSEVADVGRGTLGSLPTEGDATVGSGVEVAIGRVGVVGQSVGGGHVKLQ